ncbi:MAG: hypothetical protein IKV64_02950, partial [Clostridia bacterium]|nr:hypothetical protein [Clostridia bacterium]
LNYTVKVKPNAQTKMILRDNGDLLTVLGGADTIRYAGTLRDYNETQLTNSEPDLGFESLGGNMMIIDNVIVTACEVTDPVEELEITKIYADPYGIDVTFNRQPTQDEYAATILDHNKNEVSYIATCEKANNTTTYLVHYDFNLETGKNYRYTLGTLADKSIKVTKYLEEDFNGLTAATTTSNADGSKTVPYSAMTGTGKVGTWKTEGISFITDSEDLCASATDKKLVLGNASLMKVTGDIQTSHDDKTLIADVISLGDTYMFVNSDRVGRCNSRAVQVVHTKSAMGFINGHASEGKYKGVWTIKSTVSPTITFNNKSDGTIAGGSLNSATADKTASTLNYTVKVKPNAQTKMILRDNGDLLTVLAGADAVRHVGTLQDYNETQLTNSEPDLGFESLDGRMMIIDNVIVTACEVTDPVEELEITKIYADPYGIDVTFNRQPTQEEYTANIYDNKGNNVSYTATCEKANNTTTYLVHYDFNLETGKNYRYTLGTLADKSIRVTKYLEEDFNGLTA